MNIRIPIVVMTMLFLGTAAGATEPPRTFFAVQCEARSANPQMWNGIRRFIEKWFQFSRENKARIRTVRDIVKIYPADQIVEVKWVRQETALSKPPEGLFAKVRKFQELLKTAKAEHRDTSAAEDFDRQSRAAAKRGDTAEAERLLNKAIGALSQKKQTSSDSRGRITFAVNTHDWPHLEESAATVLRLIGIFEKHKVRGDFYFTPQIVEHYAQKRPDVIERLKQSNMCISYHVRPPHPTYAGFESPIRHLDDAALEQTLRDYETYRLDPATGKLQRDKPGGYRYVAQVFGRNPVVVSPQARDSRIRAAALKVYAEMGAKMVVAYHESGTKREEPFEWIHGLLARPSDFSVTRWERDIFWWNAPNSDPVALLKRQLADWRGGRAPFITALIHENDFTREGGTGWGNIYYEGPRSRPKQPPFNLNAPDRSRLRATDASNRIWRAYKELVAYAAANLRVVTSEDIVTMAKTPTAKPRPEKRTRPGEEFESVSTQIPSAAAGNTGIAATVLIPRQARYPEGAPVVIHVAGGVQSGSARGRPEYVRHGFVEIHFAFPGGGFDEERSGGVYDFRGPNCVRALADVIKFAMSPKLGALVRMTVLTNNVGIVGSSHGGNACGLAMAKHGTEFPNLAWYASMESPYGEGEANVELGGHESGVNPAYDPQTGKLDLSRLAWSSELSPGLFRKPMLADTRQLKGAFYFEINGKVPVNCFVGDDGNGVKAWYSPRILAEAERRKLITGARPAHIPTLAESREFWQWRDATASIPDAVRNCPNLAVIGYANERDHVQADPVHTHILEQVEGFRKAGARFVRLNPDRAYVERLAPGAARFADNPAGKTWTRANIREGLEPASLPIGVYMQAAVCELADRARAGNWSPNLDAVLHNSPAKP